MDIVSALFVENINLRQVPGPSTRIDLSGIMFSLPAPEPPPVTIATRFANSATAILLRAPPVRAPTSRPPA